MRYGWARSRDVILLVPAATTRIFDIEPPSDDNDP
jgi:hypothetical protein